MERYQPCVTCEKVTDFTFLSVSGCVYSFCFECSESWLACEPHPCTHTWLIWVEACLTIQEREVPKVLAVEMLHHRMGLS